MKMENWYEARDRIDQMVDVETGFGIVAELRQLTPVRSSAELADHVLAQNVVIRGRVHPTAGPGIDSERLKQYAELLSSAPHVEARLGKEFIEGLADQADYLMQMVRGTPMPVR